MTPLRAGAARLLVAALAGSLSVLGYAPFRIAVIPVGTLAVLFLLWRRAPSTGTAAATGFAYGLGCFLTGTSWIYVSLHTFGGMPAWLTAIATFCFCAIVALYPAAAGWLAARLGARGTGAVTHEPVAFLIAMPAAWTAGELARGYLFSGFPWLGLGYSQVPDSPLAGFAPIVGSYGVTTATAIIAGASALVAVVAIRGEWRRGSVPVAVIAIVLGAGGLLRMIEWTTPAGKPVTVALLQGNIPQERKFDREVLPAIFRQYRQMVERADAQLIVLPETALPVFLHQIDPEYLDALAAGARRRDGDILFGVAIADPTTRGYFNAVVSIGTSPSQDYRKRHLVPFGEFLPFRPVFEWVLDVLQIPMADFTPGPPDPPTLDVAGQRLALGICYEDAFGNEMLRQLPAATLLVNVSNDAWFGDSLAAEQHYQIAQMRSLESARMMLRANNTGVTAIVGTRGETVARVPGFVEATLTGVAQGRSGATLYTRIGDWGIIGLISVTIVVLAAAGRPARRHTARPISSSLTRTPDEL